MHTIHTILRSAGIVTLTICLACVLTLHVSAQSNSRSAELTQKPSGESGKSNNGKDQELAPRKLADKSQRNRVTKGSDRSRIEVKFVDGLRFSVNPRGMLLERPQRGLRSEGARELLSAIARDGGVWHRMITVEEEKMDEMRGNAQRKLGKEVADMNSYFILTVPENVDTELWLDLLNELEDVEIAQPVPLPAPQPLPDDFQPLQGYLEEATGGIDASSYAWAIAGGTGANVRIVDLEYSWNLNHQDLPSGITTLIPGGRTAVDPFNDTDHGTAVLGELVSLNNGWGTTGIAHDAEIFVAPVSWDNGYNLAAALTNAAASLSAGDILLIEQQTQGPNYIDNTSQFGLVPSEWQESVYNAIVTAVGNGIHVVEAAGNGSQDLDGAEYSAGNGGHYPFNGSKNSGAIIVGAGARPGGSTTDRSRLGFSCFGARVNVQGWGEGVMTTGYGTYYSEGPNNNLDYRSTFGGTSSASPIVTGAVALIGSMQEEINNNVMTPAAMRSLLIATGSPQQAGANPLSENIGPRPSIRAAIQSTDPCVLTCPSNISVSNDPDMCGAVVNYPAPTTSATCGTVTSTPASGSFFPVGVTVVNVMTTSEENCSFTITVNDTQPPSVTCPENITVNNDPGMCSAVVTYAASASDNCPGVTIDYDIPSGTAFPVGVTTVTVTATDAHNNSTQCSFTVTVIDNEPPTISVSVNPTSLWPPNHTMRNITATVVAADNCPGVTYALTSIVSNEADNGLGDGDTPNDVQNADYNTPDLMFRVRSERSGLGTGRIYTATYTATDAHSNTATASATVTVPFSMEKAGALGDVLPSHFGLDQNHPNPFNPSTTISYSLPVASIVTLRVFDLLGREVGTLVPGKHHDAGRFEVTFDGSRIGSGMYTYTMTAFSVETGEEFTAVKQMMLMK
ncbi:MAG: HYR domain-containing protein [Bacteroidia bacterium]|nr:HYR domain-containing protein [Bacteroidia bacterium]